MSGKFGSNSYLARSSNSDCNTCCGVQTGAIRYQNVIVQPVEAERSTNLSRNSCHGAIGEHAVIQNAYIGPYTSIYHHVTVQNCEIERCIVLEHAEIMDLDERLDSWYRRALVRAGYFQQTSEVRQRQLDWLADRNSCGDNTRCLKQAYYTRIEELKRYVEHV